MQSKVALSPDIMKLFILKIIKFQLLFHRI